MKALLKKLVRRVESFSPTIIVALGIGYLVLLAVLGYTTPAWVSFARFHLLGIAFVAWGAGKRPATVVAVLAVAVAAAADYYWTRSPDRNWLLLWNLVSRLFLYVGVGWLAAEVARLTRHLDRLAEARTAQLKAEAEGHQATSARLAEMLQRFEQVTSNINEVFWLSDLASGKIIYISPGYEKVWGRPCQALYDDSESWIGVIHPEDRAEVKRCLAEDPASHECEFRILRPGGETRWIRDRAFAVRNAEGKVYRSVGIAEDVTGRKQAEQRLAEAVELNQAILAASPMGIVAYKASGECVFCNEALARVVGGSVSAVLAGNYCQFDCWQESGLLQLAEQALREGHTRSEELFVTTRFGRPIWVDAHMAPFVSGGQPHLLHMTYDVTDRKRAQRQILEISDREQARIGQDIHDGLCQQLVSLAFDANALERKLASQQRPEAPLAARLANLLDQAISESRRLARGLFPIRLESEGLPSALEELAAALNERFQIQCRFECATPGLALEKATATHLYRVAQEALNNAVKHSRATSILIGLRADARSVELTIEDNGAGLPREAANQSRGMGLHIMDYRARAIGGALRIGPGPRGGASVSSCVPRPPAHNVPS
jgi:PAS domain S-box-containing protein